MFEGFTEEDIKPAVQGSSITSKTRRKTKPGRTNHIAAHVEPVPEKAMLTKKDSETERKTDDEIRERTNNVALNPDLLKNLEQTKDLKENKKLDFQEAKDFEEIQKRIEAENKIRKERLAKAIAERKQKTSEEAEKLKHVQTELSRIDDLLTNDVSILRAKIEESSLNFMEAQKRYDKAEAEFVAAKLNLHMSSEKKELLTEHLSRIIQKNEERKAEKLSKLMEELNL